MRHRGERRHGEGRHLLSHDGEKTSSRAGDRAQEQPALPVPGGLGRRFPAAAGRDLPRPGAFRPDFLQPGQHVGRGHPADRRGHGVVHRRRRLRAGDERREHHRPQARHHLPWRPAAGAGGDGRGCFGRGPGRRGCARPDVGCGGSLCAQRPARAGDLPPYRRRTEPAEASRIGDAAAGAAALRPGGTARRRAGRPARAL